MADYKTSYVKESRFDLPLKTFLGLKLVAGRGREIGGEWEEIRPGNRAGFGFERAVKPFTHEVAVKYKTSYLRSIQRNPLMGAEKNLHLQRAGHRTRSREMSSSMKLVLITLLITSLSIISPADAQLEEWCIADEQTPDNELQSALDWACGAGGADCRQIQLNQPCYLPNTLKDHASYAFNSYYQKFKNKGAYCYFNSAAMITAANPSKVFYLAFPGLYNNESMKLYCEKC
ncbi:hypothetical protein V2J09_012291 [Rumex salicifolius]